MKIRANFNANYIDYNTIQQDIINGSLRIVIDDFNGVGLNMGLDYVPLAGDIIDFSDNNVQILDAPDYWYLDVADNKKKEIAKAIICIEWIVKSRLIRFGEIHVLLRPGAKEYR
jgi:hypothetical protein